MNEIITEGSEGLLRVELNRPSKRNAMTSRMYVTLADVFNDVTQDEYTGVALWHGAGDSFCAGNDMEDFLKNPPGPGESPQARLMNALIDLDKPQIAAVHGAAIGGGTTMLTHCDFVYPGGGLTHLMKGIGIALDVPGDRMFATDFAGSIYSARLDTSSPRASSALQTSTRLCAGALACVGASWAT
jgi:enoyl-CoA hydratase/carnithine racemase